MHALKRHITYIYITYILSLSIFSAGLERLALLHILYIHREQLGQDANRHFLKAELINLPH